MEIVISKPVYEKKTLKHNSRLRKKLGILEYGNGLIQLQMKHTEFTREGLDFLTIENDVTEESSFSVTTDEKTLYLSFMTDEPYYRPSKVGRYKRAESRPESLQDDTVKYVSKYVTRLSPALQASVDKVIISDWDFIDLDKEIV